jgi:hypothetical protein
MAAILRCGDGAALSHSSAAELWEIRPPRREAIEVSVPAHADHRPPGIRVHRRNAAALFDATVRDRLPVTSPEQTLLDLARRLGVARIEAA